MHFKNIKIQSNLFLPRIKNLLRKIVQVFNFKVYLYPLNDKKMKEENVDRLIITTMN